MTIYDLIWKETIAGRKQRLPMELLRLIRYADTAALRGEARRIGDRRTGENMG